MIERLLRTALEDAEVLEDTTILFVVTGNPPMGAAEYAYLPPGDWALEVRVLRDVGRQLEAFLHLHRFGAYSQVPRTSEAAIAVGLRHEVQHAAQFDLHGPGLLNLDSILRRVMSRAGRADDYRLIPMERDANRAANAYARDRYAADVDALGADPRFQQFVDESDPVVDLVQETADMIWNYTNESVIDDQDTHRRQLGAVVPELVLAAERWTPIDPRYRVKRAAAQPLVVQINPAGPV